MDPLTIRLTVAKIKPDKLAVVIAGWLRGYEESHESHPGDWGDPDLIERNALALSAALSSYIDAMLSVMADEIAHAVAKQAFAIGAGRPFPEIQILAAPQATTMASVERRPVVQSVERDPETLEVVRTVSK
jgi:hypothetical protein